MIVNDYEIETRSAKTAGITIKQINNGYLISFGRAISYWFFSTKEECVEFISNEIDSVFQDNDG